MNSQPESAYVDETPASYTPRASRTSPSPFAQVVSTLFMSVLIYYLAPLIPIWPEQTKRAIWEAFVFVTPSRVIYAMDHLPTRLFGQHEAGTESAGAGSMKFQKSDFGNNLAKSEALRRLLHLDGQPSLVPAVGRARAFSSGLGSMFSSTRSDLPPGLGNWDNSCYQNSIIQGLASLPTLKTFVDGNLDRMSLYRNMPTHQALHLISTKLNDQSHNGKCLWTPQALKSMSSWQQQDAQEYYTKVVDSLEKEALTGSSLAMAANGLVEGLKQTSLNPSNRDFDEDHAADAAMIKPSEKELHESKHGFPLEGLLAQRVGCVNCGYCEGLTLIPFTFLTLPLGRDWEVDIRDCLDEYASLENIDGVECSKCSVLRAKNQLEKMVANAEAAAETQDQSQDGGTSDLRKAAISRLNHVNQALAESNFSDKTLKDALKIGPKSRVSSTKSRQAIIARAPKSLVLHVNRSVFDEMTGAQYKNTAVVRFPLRLDLSHWSLGNISKAPAGEVIEFWETDPSKSMLGRDTELTPGPQMYELKAVVTHQGRHENGHYIAFRKRPWISPAPFDVEGEDIELESRQWEDRWFRFSDESVSMVTEDVVLAQGGVFMLFYEAIEDATPDKKQIVEDIAVTQGPSKVAEPLVVVAKVHEEVVSDDDSVVGVVQNHEERARPATDIAEEESSETVHADLIGNQAPQCEDVDGKEKLPIPQSGMPSHPTLDALPLHQPSKNATVSPETGYASPALSNF